MADIAGKKSSFSIFMNLTVLALVLIWIIPTLGLFVSSFRDRDQISETGWWRSFLPAQQGLRARASVDNVVVEGDRFFLTGSLFDDEEVMQVVGDTRPPGAAFGNTGRDPGEFPVGEVADLGDGETLLVNTDGSYEYILTEHPGSRGPRIYFFADTPPIFSFANYRLVLTADNMDQASSTR